MIFHLQFLFFMGKNYEKVLKQHFMEQFGNNISDYQFVFEENRNPTHPLTIITSNIHTARLTNQYSPAIFIDIN